MKNFPSFSHWVTTRGYLYNYQRVHGRQPIVRFLKRSGQTETHDLVHLDATDIEALFAQHPALLKQASSW
jgi:hypothetical protein